MEQHSQIVPALGTVLVRRYELIEEIGRGGCAVVFEAHDLRLDRLVAIKLPMGVASDAPKSGQTDRMSRFAREGRVIATIHHPNVCAVLDSGVTEDGVPFLVMERLFGESLRASITRSGMLPISEAIAIGLQLLSALDAVHAAGILHRDIKPDNIILVSRGGCDPLVKLLDFGLCRRSSSRPRGSEEETMTVDGAIIGTPEYMAPEQVIGSASLDVRVDIYAAGVVLYEALSGDRAFFAKSVRDILSGVMTKKIRPLRQVRRDMPASLEAVIARAMDRNPARRPRTALELQEQLLAVKGEMMAERRRSFSFRASGSLPRPGARSVPVEVDAWDLPTTRFERTGERPIAATAAVAPPPPQRPRRVTLTPPSPPRYSRTG